MVSPDQAGVLLVNKQEVRRVAEDAVVRVDDGFIGIVDLTSRLIG